MAMALSVGCAGFLLLTLLHVPKTLGRSNSLCPQTSFYHDCWIRRFPGLFLNLPVSEQRGAQLLQTEMEPSAQHCSRKCCDQAPCNLAVSFLDISQGRVSCHLVHCPHPESCILHQKDSAVLYTVTAGIDPDLLVFEKLGQIDLNPRSSMKLHRLNTSGAVVPPVPLPQSFLSSKDPQPAQQSSAPPKSPTESSLPLPTSSHHSIPTSSHRSLPHPPGPGDSIRSFPPTKSPLFTTPCISETTSVSQSKTSSLAETSHSEDPLTSRAPVGQPIPNPHSPAHLDSNKQHVNDTKGHSGKNQSSDAEVEDASGSWLGLWLFPGLVGSSVALLCCCSGIMMLGCCRRRKRGRYRPGQVADDRRGSLIRFALLKEKE
ncbi:MANSC domain-containing protein 4 isoform X2 [Xenopus laevis]|uniref:MANSC domain-containing protein 4 isoform X2 n=1 Tax=Xenopus laevis TaxID=8355 RepID=A0A8J0UVH4_XENLA|nr:MANSC domain-containing protein 4 isoform X2 [Xenopus laevis]